jgi:hypothetical protein
MAAKTKTTSKSTPPKIIKRNEYGLTEGLDYVFQENGLVDWRKMIKPEFLVPNRQRTQETNVSELQDRDLIILLGGIKDLAQIRGFTDVRYDVKFASLEYAAASCTIKWTPNYETENGEVTFQSMSSATVDNTNGFGKLYLVEMAENRSFCRCVRNFLKINIVSWDEMSGASPSSASSSAPASVKSKRNALANPSFLLAKKMKEKGVSFEDVVGKITKEEMMQDPEGITELEDIPKSLTFKLIERINKLG